MGSGVRQCPDCGWTCYGSRKEMKKHRRAKHRTPRPAQSSWTPPTDPLRAEVAALTRATDAALNQMRDP